MTPHNEASRGDFAETVLLPGDPLRAEWIAKTFLDDARVVNRLRGETGYTGTFRGIPISVQSTGVGAPSLAIYAHELLDAYRVKTLIRIGSCGGLTEKAALRSLVVSQSVSADSSINRQIFGAFDYAPSADFGLLKLTEERAAALGIPILIGPTVSSDIFYQPDPDQASRWSQRGILAVEMEASVLFTLGALRGIQAGCMLLVSDIVVAGEFIRITDDEMRAAVDQMTELALHTVTA